MENSSQKRLGKQEIRKRANAFAKNGLDRQAIYDEVVKPFPGRERDIANIVCSVFPLNLKEKWAWSYFALTAVAAISAATALLIPFIYPFDWEFIQYFTWVIILSNFIYCSALLGYATGFDQNYYLWLLAQFGLAAIVIFSAGFKPVLIALAAWTVTGIVMQQIVSRKLWGKYKHSAHQITNAQNQIIAVSKIQFLR